MNQPDADLQPIVNTKAGSKKAIVFDESRSIFGNIRLFSEPRIRKALEKTHLSVSEREDFLQDCLRHYDPWPEWVLSVATEVFSAYLPRVRKKTIFNFFKALHWLFLEVKLNDQSTNPPRFDFPPDFQHDIFRVFGHLYGHDERMQEKISDLEKTGSDSKLTKIKEELSALKTQAKEVLLTYYKTRPAENLPMNLEILVDAKRATYDENGNLRTTRATEIYEEILKNWQIVEKMSGPAELCRFLDPLLGVSDEFQKSDRVIKICKRMGIFRSASLPDKAGG